MKDLFTWLGGQAEKNINADGFSPRGNTCASRLSVAFNLGGAQIDKQIAKQANAPYLTDKSSSAIIFRVTAFRDYLTKLWGKPLLDKAKPFDDAFVGKQGIIAFTVNWDGASGHISLWNGHQYREPAHDNYARYVHPRDPNVHTVLGELWEVP